MEDTKVLEKLYEEARKVLPQFERKLRMRDLDNKVVHSSGSQTIQFLPKDGDVDGYDLRNISLTYLKEKGFNSKSPNLREFCEKNGLEKELDLFVELFSEAILQEQTRRYNAGISEAREQGINDAMKSYGLNDDSHGWVWVGTRD